MDESNLVARGSLSETLQQNLEASNYLILICSPNSAKSEYVNDEVSCFVNNSIHRRIIPLIIDGKPCSDDPSTECFPPAILGLSRGDEPLGIDFKKHGMRDAFLRGIATMLVLDLDAFISREARERKKKAVTFASIAAALVMTAGGLVWYNIDFFRDMLYIDEIQIDLGHKYFLLENYTEAAKRFEKSAALGNATAQNNLGYMYQKGLGVEQDYVKL